MLRKWFTRMTPVLACLVMALPASAQVSDELNLFSKDARDRAARDIAEIKRVHHANLLIETRAAPSIPESVKKNPKELETFISKWAASQFANHKANVYVVITEKPNRVRVQVGSDTQSKGYFRMEDADRLRDKITENLKKGKKDDALTDATAFVNTTMDLRPKNAANARQAAAAPAENNNGGGISIMTILLWVGGFLLVFWVVRALIGALSGGGGYGGAPGYAGGGGGGFFSSMMGGLFGAAAGMWMYNHFFGHSTPSAWGGQGGSEGGLNDTSSTGTTGDWSPDGGNDAGGGAGDWGGGDAGGGGDWGGDAGGGGDWGGGGGDFGGGGGDW